MLKHLKGARIMQDCSTGKFYVDTGTHVRSMGVDSWDDLSDKPFYTEEAVVAERQTVSRSIVFTHGIVEGQIYEVIWDDQTYLCTAWNTGETYGSDVVLGSGVVGDVYTGGFNGEDVPFFIDEDGHVTCGGTHIVEIKCKITHRIDSKYMPCDLMFKVGCTSMAHPKYAPNSMKKPIIVSGSLEAVLEKLANGEIPVVKVQYQAYSKGESGPLAFGYGGEFTCDTYIYATDVIFTHDIPAFMDKISAQIVMNTDDPNFLEMAIYSSSVVSSPIPIE